MGAPNMKEQSCLNPSKYKSGRLSLEAEQSNRQDKGDLHGYALGLAKFSLQLYSDSKEHDHGSLGDQRPARQ